MSIGTRPIFVLLLVFGLLLLGGSLALAQGYSGLPAQGDPDKANPDSANSITLPNSGSTTTAGTAWSITNNGTGIAGYYNLNNKNSNNPALEARTVATATSATALTALAVGTQGGSSSAALRAINYSTTAGYGVFAQQMGAGTGVYSLVSGAGGRGVVGYSTAASGAGIGVYGKVASTSGIGVYAASTATSGATIGVYGVAASTGGKGVYGSGTATSGAGVGVYGQTQSPGGYAGYFNNNGAYSYGFPVVTTVGIRVLASGGAASDIHPSSRYNNAAGEFAGANGVIGAAAYSSTAGYGVLGIGGRVNGYGVLGTGGGIGVYGSSTSGGGLGGEFIGGVVGAHGLGTQTGLLGEGNQEDSTGVVGIGVYYGVRGETSGDFGTGGKFTGATTGVSAQGGFQGVGATGVSYGVIGSSSLGKGGSFSGKTGIEGRGDQYGVDAYCITGSIDCYGVHSLAQKSGSGNAYGGSFWGSNFGVVGVGATTAIQGGLANNLVTTYGVVGFGNDVGVWGVEVGGGGLAGQFSGNVLVTGNMDVNGSCCLAATLTTRNANPGDANSYIDQAGVVSGELLGVQSGNVTLDGKGEAVVSMPGWYQAEYRDFRYSLTPFDDFAPLYLAQRMKDNQFRIAGGKPGMTVSWLVSGVRQDKYAKDHPLQNLVSKAEVDKAAPRQPVSGAALPPAKPIVVPALPQDKAPQRPVISAPLPQQASPTGLPPAPDVP